MLKGPALFAAVALVSALPAAGAQPCSNGEDLSWLFEEPAPEFAWLYDPAADSGVSTDPASPAAIALASTGRKPGGTIQAFCQANCESGTVSCSGNVCSAYNRNCPNEDGHVVCDGVYTWCPTTCPPPSCTLYQCKQPCKQPGCVAVCIDLENCECETICN